MTKLDFDRFAESYNVTLAQAMPELGAEDGYFAEYKVALMARRVARQPLRILDFGCGIGRSLSYLRRYFPEAELWGFDLSQESLRIASQTQSDTKLCSVWTDIETVSFDAIFAANVFHHIAVPERLTALTQCHDVLSTDGEMFLFEHNPFNPVTRLIFERCPFDADAEMLSAGMARRMAKSAGFRHVMYRYTLFFPRPLAFLRRFEPLLARIPLGAQYYVQMAK